MSRKYGFGERPIRAEHNAFQHLPVEEVIAHHTFRSRYALDAQILPNVAAERVVTYRPQYQPCDLCVQQVFSRNMYDGAEETPLGRYMRFRRDNTTRRRYITGSIVQGETGIECVSRPIE